MVFQNIVQVTTVYQTLVTQVMPFKSLSPRRLLTFEIHPYSLAMKTFTCAETREMYYFPYTGHQMMWINRHPSLSVYWASDDVTHNKSPPFPYDGHQIMWGRVWRHVRIYKASRLDNIIILRRSETLIKQKNLSTAA